MKALITGVNGMDGSYLSELLLSKDYIVYGMVRRSSTNTKQRIQHLLGKPNFNIIEGDITDCSGMIRLIDDLKPDEVYNLAAMSSVGTSFAQPIATCHIDAVGPLNILEAIRICSPQTKFLQASTSELVGDTTVSPQNENTPFNPNSPYAAAKLYAHHLVGLYRRAYNIFSCASICFNHTGPRRGEDFVTRKVSKYVAKLSNFIEINGREPILGDEFPHLRLGNLEARRDWTFAGDVVVGMWLMMQQDEPDDYIFGSGKTWSIRQLLEIAFGIYGLSYQKYVIADISQMRPADVGLLLADASKAKNKLGWRPTIEFLDLIKMMVENDRGNNV